MVNIHYFVGKCEEKKEPPCNFTPLSKEEYENMQESNTQLKKMQYNLIKDAIGDELQDNKLDIANNEIRINNSWGGRAFIKEDTFKKLLTTLKKINFPLKGLIIESEVIPKEVCDFPLLETLDFGNGGEKIPECIGNLTNLKHLYIGRTSENVPISFANLKQLETFNFGNATAVEKFIANPNIEFKNLKQISVDDATDNNNINADSFFKNLSRIAPTIEYVDLTYFRDYSIPPTISLLKNLKDINIEASNVKRFPLIFNTMPQLESIRIGGSSISSLKGINKTTLKKVLVGTAHRGDLPALSSRCENAFEDLSADYVIFKKFNEEKIDDFMYDCTS